ncbi:MAG TPA: OmpA family protein [Acidocella sp.]|jgi:outer membrane protein OmpA-like peptidoglycan-associated protein|uniref:OmpA family protein n=1 Tax=Acidocella sp. TaxID=50710 RepID=UPI002CE60467|nr:OmpA family protein [Acidocella sp.]HVE22662.1 OmpA family protein [Acidocella sp.]
MRRIAAVMSLAVIAAWVASGPAAKADTKTYPVFFQPWSAAISKTASETIAAAARAALADPSTSVIVTGAADTVGSALANKYMSEARAQVVSDALAADGVAASRIKVRASGATEAPGAAPGSYAQFSRRALIQVSD